MIFIIKDIFTKFGFKGFITGIILCFILDLLGVNNIILRTSFVVAIILIGYGGVFFINKIITQWKKI
ncbi:hypothetical protein OR62_14155 (plasmid) [Clostridium tetani]|uniref:PspC domain-containing protein n=1 Tax=Clostridium tetani TaxID=1513 RepID=A0ABY0EQ06_CLOTA|nr:hypothetical protein [Clostridium tetani]KHO31640.1 hypothetical protein OR62_14155 [Clostridium tetani]RXI57033.1 hypothetical protein DP131_06215 [Clostridium tetani]RXI74314.1 hypothetical protein DQN76_00315 [Clostridium tetani]